MKEFDYSKNYTRDVRKEGIVEKKQQFEYLSWSHCEKMANEMDENFDWCLIKNEIDGSLLHNGTVLIQMTFNGKTREHYYPVLNFKNQPIAEPTSFDINNAQMRGFAKLFSMMTGVGLSIFTGEDLVQYEKNQEDIKQHGKVISETDLKKEIMKTIKKLVSKEVYETESVVLDKYGLVQGNALTKEDLSKVLASLMQELVSLELDGE